MIAITIKDIIGTPNAILQKFGLQLFDRIDDLLSHEDKIEISFRNIANVTTGFMNASFGNLYKKYGVKLDQMISLSNLDDPDWKEKFDDAKSLALNPDKAKIIDEAIADLFD